MERPETSRRPGGDVVFGDDPTGDPRALDHWPASSAAAIRLTHP
jgi:hypothetical protein